MPCLLALLGAFFPRVLLVLFWLTGYGGRAFETMLVPLLGFLFMPFTTCFYAIATNSFGGLQGMGLFLLILGVIFDLGGWGGTHSSAKRRRAR